MQLHGSFKGDICQMKSVYWLRICRFRVQPYDMKHVMLCYCYCSLLHPEQWNKKMFLIRSLKDSCASDWSEPWARMADVSTGVCAADNVYASVRAFDWVRAIGCQHRMNSGTIDVDASDQNDILIQRMLFEVFNRIMITNRTKPI